MSKLVYEGEVIFLRKIVVLKSFLLEVIHLIDSGVTISVEELKGKIDSRNFISWLIEVANQENVTLNSLQHEDKMYLEELFDNYAYNYEGDEFSKWGIRNNGLNLLIAYGISELRELDKNEEI